MSSYEEQYNRGGGVVWGSGVVVACHPMQSSTTGCGGMWGSGVVAGCHPMQSSTTGVGMCGGVGWWLDVIQCRAVQRVWGYVGEWCGGCMSSNAEQYNRVWGCVGEWCGGWMSSNAEQYNRVWGCVGECGGGCMSSNEEQYNGGGGVVWGSGVVAGCHPMQSSTTGVGMCGGVVWWLDVIQCRAVQRGWGCVGEWCGGWMSSNAEQYNTQNLPTHMHVNVMAKLSNIKLSKCLPNTLSSLVRRIVYEPDRCLTCSGCSNINHTLRNYQKMQGHP